MNTREILRDFSQPRGSVTTADGVVIARSVPSGDRFKFQREFPKADLFAHVSGFFSFTLGSSGVEKTYNDELAGRTLDLSKQDLRRPVRRQGPRRRPHPHRAQGPAADRHRAARRPEGSVVALDPRTGAILAPWCQPHLRPQRHRRPRHPDGRRRAAPARRRPEQAPADPKRTRSATSPGSTFKVVTATAGLASGQVTDTSPSYPVSNAKSWRRAPTSPLTNFGGESCGGTSSRSPAGVVQHRLRPDGRRHRPRRHDRHGGGLRLQPGRPHRPHGTSGVELPHRLQRRPARARPVGHRPERRAGHAAADGDGRRRHRQPRPDDDAPRAGDECATATATSSTPTTPSRVDHRHGQRRRRPHAHEGHARRRENGTATRPAVPGFEVGGKTGTAQLGTDPPRSHAWIIGFGGPPASPRSPSRCIVEGQPGASEQTGGRVAAPIAQQPCWTPAGPALTASGP